VGREDEAAADIVAGDAVAVDQVPDKRRAVAQRFDDPASLGLAEVLEDVGLAMLGIGHDLAEGTAGSARAEAARLEQRHTDAALGEMERGAQPREAAADDGDLGRRLAREGWCVRRWRAGPQIGRGQRGGIVERADVLHAGCTPAARSIGTQRSNSSRM
jgi:hypothetical protein